MTLGTITLTPLSYPGADVTAKLNADAPMVEAGGARWDKLERPRRRSALEYSGEDLLTLKLGIWLDEFPDGEVEGLCRRIYGWWARNDKDQPTIIRITGPVPYSDLDYVIDKIDSSGEVEHRGDGMRCRQELKFEFLQYVAPDLITEKTATPATTAAQTAASTGPAVAVALATAAFGTSGTYTVARGETLSSIAAKKLGSASKWPSIADLNGIRDPRTLKAGQVLRLP